MTKTFVLVGMMFGGLAFSAPGLVCEDSDYRLVISDSAETAKVTHKKSKETKFWTETFEKKGGNTPRYEIRGTAKALKYEGTPSEHWYEGEAFIRTSAKLVDDEVVYSAEFLISYDPYYEVVGWTDCTRK